MSAPPVEAGRRAPPLPPTAEPAPVGRLACSLQSLRGRLSRGRAPEAAAAAAETAGEGSGGTAALNGDSGAGDQSRRGADREGTAPGARPDGKRGTAGGSRDSTGAPSETGVRVDGGDHRQAAGGEPGHDAEGKRKSVDSATPSSPSVPRAASLGAADRETTRQSVPDFRPNTSPAAAKSTTGRGETSSPVSTGSSEAAPEKPHVCGSFFSPCCSARRAGGVKTFSGGSATFSGASAASSGGPERRRSPVSLARILARPVFATSPPAPTRKKSSVVYFHPEFQPGVIGEDDGAESSGPR